MFRKVLVALALVFGLVAGLAGSPAGTAYAQTAGETGSLSPAITSARTALDNAESEIARLERQVEENAGSDSALVDLKLKVEALARSMLDIGVSLRPRLNEIKARIDQLGATPGEGEPEEPEAIVEERKRLAEERALINTLTGRAEDVSIRASNLGDTITEKRRQVFTDTLLQRTEIGGELFSQAKTALATEIADLNRIVGSWLTFVWSFKRMALLGTAFLSLVAALFFVAGGQRLFGSLYERDPEIEKPSYISRLSVAFWSTVIPSLAVTAMAITIYALMNSFAVLRSDMAPIISVLLAVSCALYFVTRLARAILAPFAPRWRLVDVSNSGARTLFWLVFLLALVNGLDYLLGSISEALGSPVVLTVAKGFVAAILMGVLLIITSRVKPMRAADGDPGSAGEALPRIISLPLLLAGLALLGMALTGYIGMARFAATQIVVTGAILATMYIGHLSARAISESGVFAKTAIGAWVDKRFEPGQVTLDQAGLAAGLLLHLLVLLIGIPLILLQWGFRVEDIQLWLYRLLTDIRIGGITISLVGIFFGVVMFVVGLFATRWFQRWLDGEVMARGRVDTGVRNSIKTGIGYLGVAVAGLIGISVAGLDLSSLALVAGALSLGIGFGLQNIVSNFVSGLILLAERPFKVGDWVVTGSTEGFVRKISVRATEIETFQRQSIIVPNSELINGAVGNWTHRNSLGRADVAIGVDYGADPRQVMQILQEIAESHEMVLRNPPPVVHFVNFGESSLDFELKVFVADVLTGMAVRNDLRIAIYERLKSEGIEIPFPQRDLNIKLGEDAAELKDIAKAVLGERSLRVPEKAGIKPDIREKRGAAVARKSKRQLKQETGSMYDTHPDEGESQA